MHPSRAKLGMRVYHRRTDRFGELVDIVTEWPQKPPLKLADLIRNDREFGPVPPPVTKCIAYVWFDDDVAAIELPMGELVPSDPREDLEAAGARTFYMRDEREHMAMLRDFQKDTPFDNLIEDEVFDEDDDYDWVDDYGP